MRSSQCDKIHFLVDALQLSKAQVCPKIEGSIHLGRFEKLALERADHPCC
jgi:hypothetical protein